MPALTPERYAQAVKTLSHRCSDKSVFPGDHYLDLSQWMQHYSLRQERPKSPIGTGTQSADKSEDDEHELVVVYSYTGNKWEITHYRQDQHETFNTSLSQSDKGCNQIIFIRGYITPAWISTLGSRLQIDPEFFRRHMDFLANRIHKHAFNLPSLVSTSAHLMKLCVSTILQSETYDDQDLYTQRTAQAAELKTYKSHRVGGIDIACGDSIVRDYATLCHTFSVIEQWITMHPVKTDKGWVVIAWLDQGRPLVASPGAPWNTNIERNAMALPIIQNHRKMAFRTTANRLSTKVNEAAQVQQSTVVLPLQFDSILALVDLTRRASSDLLSLCIPLFAHAAFSEAQLLNLLESRIQMQTQAVSDGMLKDALAGFQFFSSIIDRHIKHLRDNLRALERLYSQDTQKSAMDTIVSQNSVASAKYRASVSGLSTPSDSLLADGPFTAAGILEDFDDLIRRCNELSEMCSRGITLAMNKAAIDESRKGIEQSERVKRLTILATFFIPLNFCSSIFGMNFDIFGQGDVSPWWFFVICIPIVMLACLLYFWDWPKVKCGWAELRTRLVSRFTSERSRRDHHDKERIV